MDVIVFETGSSIALLCDTDVEDQDMLDLPPEIQQDGRLFCLDK